jgi:hypothetical protein
MDDGESGVSVVAGAGSVLYSRDFPNRAVMAVPFGFALYEREDGVGVHVGVADQRNAWLWLSGRDLNEIVSFPVFREESK